MTKVIANLLITLGVVFLGTFGVYFYQINNLNRLKINTQDIDISRHADVEPISLQIADLGIKLPVVITTYDGKYWNTTSEGVSYIGNNIYYGHNWRSILGNLQKAKVGQIVEIKLSDGNVKNYEITEIQIVEPNNSGVLKKADENTLVIYTCAGFLDSKRFVVTASILN